MFSGRRREHLPAGDDRDLLDVRPVQAARRAARRARRGGAVDPLPDRHHRARAREVGRLDEVGVGHLDAADLLLLQLATDGSLKRSSQTTSLGDEPLGLRGEQRALPRPRPSSPASAGTPRRGPRGRRRGSSSESIERSCESKSGPGGSSLRARSTPISCCWTRPGELLLQLGRLDPRRRQHVAELAADPLGVARDGRHVGHVAAVGVALRVLLAALHPEQQQDDDQDRERDQAEQAQQRREAGARTDRAARQPGPRPPSGRRSVRSLRPGASCVSGSSKKSNSKSVSRLLMESGGTRPL